MKRKCAKLKAHTEHMTHVKPNQLNVFALKCAHSFVNPLCVEIEWHEQRTVAWCLIAL